jgi:hypothetical protein
LTSICAFNIDHSSWKANTIVLIWASKNLYGHNS